MQYCGDNYDEIEKFLEGSDGSISFMEDGCLTLLGDGGMRIVYKGDWILRTKSNYAALVDRDLFDKFYEVF